MWSFSSWLERERGQVAYTLAVRYLHREKSGILNFGEHAGQGMLLNHETEWPGNIPIRKAMICFVVCVCVRARACACLGGGGLQNPVETMHFSPFASSFTVP
jgi:hypothetical protein